jgi:hypothetical protein
MNTRREGQPQLVGSEAAKNPDRSSCCREVNSGLVPARAATDTFKVTYDGMHLEGAGGRRDGETDYTYDLNSNSPSMVPTPATSRRSANYPPEFRRRSGGQAGVQGEHVLDAGVPVVVLGPAPRGRPAKVFGLGGQVEDSVGQ